MKNLLITFGCSWTFGVGIFYKEGMTEKEYWGMPKVFVPENPFRKIIAKELDADNLNFSIGASSNDKQLRYAKHFFASNKFKELQKEYDNIIVLWGITATSRIEIWDYRKKDINNLILKPRRRFTNGDFSVNEGLSKNYLRYFYDHDHEVFLLAKEMNFWNTYFQALGIQNYWFDTFNHHDYYKSSNAAKHITTETGEGDRHRQDNDKILASNDVIPNHVELESVQQPQKIDNLLFDDRQYRDLCSILAIDSGLEKIDDQYHDSIFDVDCNKIGHLIENGFLNPHSLHPTAQGHQSIASFMLKEINTL